MEVLLGTLIILLSASGVGVAWYWRRTSELVASLDGQRVEVARLRDHARDAVDERDQTVRRVKEHAEVSSRFAHEPLARDLLDVVDSLERCAEAVAGTEHAGGVRLILAQFQATLRRHGVERLDTVGAAFDPSQHEAVAVEVDALAAPQTVLKEWSGGYRLNDRLLRAARVVVAEAPTPTVEAVVDVDAVAAEVILGATDSLDASMVTERSIPDA
jgi:molecular chaperone GrpE